MAKTGKDREGSDYSPKGMTSERGAAIETETQAAVAEKYDVDEDDLPGNVHIRHPNRNPDKKAGNTKKNGTSGSNVGATTAHNNYDETLVIEEIRELNAETLKSLSSFQSTPSISIYLPTHPSGVEVNERVDFLALKSAIQQATSSLKSTGVDDESIKRILSPAHQLLKNERFWKQLSPGIALFLAEGHSKYFKIPFFTSGDSLHQLFIHA